MIGAAMLGSACSVLPSAGGNVRHIAALMGPPVPEFHVRGRASLRQGSRVDHFRFDWQHAPHADMLLISSPFGQGVGRMSRTSDGASLHLADGRSEQAESISALAVRLLGAPVPIEHLADWVRGAMPQLSGSAGDWAVDIEATDTLELPDQGGPHTLPRILGLRNGEISLRLVIDQRDGG